MVGAQHKYVVCDWIPAYTCYIVLILDHWIKLGRIFINEISSSALKLMKIGSTAECDITLDEQNKIEDRNSSENLIHDTDMLQTVLETFQADAPIRVGCFWKKEKIDEYDDPSRSLQIQYIDSVLETYSIEKRKHFLKSNTLLKNYMIVSNQDDIKERVKFETELVKNWMYIRQITDKSSSLVLYQDLLQTRTCKNWFMNSLKSDKRIKMKIEKEANRKGMSEKLAALLAKCDYVNRCISHHELMIRKEELLSLQRLTQDMSRIAIQRFESYFNDNPTDDCLGTSIEMNLQDTSGPVSIRTNGELRKEDYNLFTNSTKCQLCVDRNKAVNWCNTCGKNICDFCKVFHQKVWDVMDHDILPLRIAY